MFIGSRIQQIGYSSDLTVIRESNFSGTFIEKISASDLSRSNFRGATIKFIDAKYSPVDMSEVDLRGTHIEAITNLDGLKLTGAWYDDTSQLPFDDQEAASKGMIKK